MKTLKIAFLATLLNFISFNHAFAFEDPSKLMTQLDAFLGGSSFAEAFKQGDRFQLVRNNCDKITNNCSKMTSRYEVISADADKGEVATYIGNRTTPSSIAKVNKKQWQEISGNMARNVVREIESYGAAVTLNSLKELSYTVIISGQSITQSAMEIGFVYKPSVGPQARQRLVLARGLRGPGQIVRRSIDDGLGSLTVTELLDCTLN